MHQGSTITDNKWTRYVNQEMNKVIPVDFIPVPDGMRFQNADYDGFGNSPDLPLPILMPMQRIILIRVEYGSCLNSLMALTKL